MLLLTAPIILTIPASGTASTFYFFEAFVTPLFWLAHVPLFTHLDCTLSCLKIKEKKLLANLTLLLLVFLAHIAVVGVFLAPKSAIYTLPLFTLVFGWGSVFSGDDFTTCLITTKLLLAKRLPIFFTLPCTSGVDRPLLVGIKALVILELDKARCTRHWLHDPIAITATTSPTVIRTYMYILFVI